MKKLIRLIAMFAIAGVATADLIVDSDFSGTGFGAVNTGAIELEAFCDTVGWTTYALVDTAYDTVNNEIDRIGTVSSGRAFGQAFRVADIRAWSATDKLSVAWTGTVSSDQVVIQVMGTSDTTWGGRPRLQDTALPTAAVDLGSFTMADITTTGGIMAAAISDWSAYTYIVVRVGSENWDGGNISVQSVDIVPEPATVGMLGLGALVALLIRRIRA